MNTSVQKSKRNHLTTTQIGAIGEAAVAIGITLASKGRLAPFKPLADDDGIDLLIYDKVTKRALPIQVKSRTKFDNDKAETVQFDVQKTTYADEGGSHLLAVLMDGTNLTCSWLIPMTALSETARQGKNKYTIVPSAKSTSKDRYSRFRRNTFSAISDELIRAFSE